MGMASLGEIELESINNTLKTLPGSKLATRRRIREALRSYYAAIDARPDDSKITDEEKEAADGSMAMETMMISEVEKQAMDTTSPSVSNAGGPDKKIDVDSIIEDEGKVNSTPIEHWLDDIKPDYGERFAHIFKDHGCTTVREMASLGEIELESINNTLKTLPGSKLATRRRIREAPRSHYAAIDARPDDSKITDEEKEAAKKMAMLEYHETNKTEEIREPEESSSYNFTAQRKAAELQEDHLASSSSSEDEN